MYVSACPPTRHRKCAQNLLFASIRGSALRFARGLKAAQTGEGVSLLELGLVLLHLGGIEINHLGIQIEFDLMESVDWFLDGLGQIFQTIDRLAVHSFYGHVVQLRVTNRVVASAGFGLGKRSYAA